MHIILLLLYYIESYCGTCKPMAINHYCSYM